MRVSIARSSVATATLECVDGDTGKYGQRHARTHAIDLQQRAEQRPLILAAKTEQQRCVLPKHLVDAQPQAAARGWQGKEGGHRGFHFVPDALHVDQKTLRIFLDQ